MSTRDSDRAEQPPTKRAYRTPKLVVHGDLRKLTLGKGSNYADGSGSPKTRTQQGNPQG